MIKRCKLVVAVSEATKRDIVDYLGCDPEKIKVIYNGYDSSVFNLASADGGEIARHYRVNNYILAVGPTYPHKNFEVLLRAYSSLSDSVKENFPLVIAGGMRKYVDRLKEVISEYNLGRHVKFLGYVPSILMPQLYGSARVLVFPSLYEGFGFPILEAMACGCPVIASNVSSIPEVCGDSALLFDPTNETELVGLILKLIGSEELREELVSKGLQQATRFSWDEAGKKWIELLESIK
jgi:glycosyltransferase involved in cell wall biosynthesis